MSIAQAGRRPRGHLAQPLLSFPQGEVMGKDGNMRVFCPQAELLGRAQGEVPSLKAVSHLEICRRATDGHS